MTSYDAVVVGARIGGAAVATYLARAGWQVLLVDRDALPSDTVSTHQVFPHGLAVLDDLGALDRLRRDHDLRPVRYSWRVQGHEVAGAFTPVGGFDRMVSVRRPVLDAALLDTAVRAGAELRTRTAVTALVGAGTAADPVRGVVLADGTEVAARWVVGADGRSSTVARRLGLADTDGLRGDLAMLFGYWTGLPGSDWCRIDVRDDVALMSSPCEDGVHLLVVSGPAELTRGSADDRRAAYLRVVERFPDVVDPGDLAGATPLGPVVSAPETMLRGFRRAAAGAGWALVGDAGLYKHPATGQGISDALTQGRRLAATLLAGQDLDGYARWRDARDAGHYEFSFAAGTLRTPGADVLYAGLAADPVASQQFLDLFTKVTAPHEVLTAERTARYRAASTYAQGLAELDALLADRDDEVLAVPVPACPGWTVGDLLAHLVGVARDSAEGRFFSDAMVAWREPSAAQARERWTAGHVSEHASTLLADLVARLHEHGAALATALRRGTAPVAGSPDWGASAPVTDLAAHVGDLREALGQAPEPRSPLTRWGLTAYRGWLHLRLVETGLPALVVGDGTREWTVGEGPPAGSLTAEPYELFRMLSGRRSAARIRAAAWSTDPEPYLPVISPYPLPAHP